MANQEIHIKDFYDTEEGYRWLDAISKEYSKLDWERDLEVRLISNGTVQIWVAFRKRQPELFDEDCLEDNNSSTDIGI